MNRKIFGILLALGVSATAFGQGARSFKINEVVTTNDQGLVDEYGDRSGWIEIVNDSWGTNNIRSCYLTTDRRTLDETMSVPDRVKLMSLIPKGDERTNLEAKQFIVFYTDGHTNRGTLHTNFQLNPETANFIALFDGNGRTLLDSITIPPLSANQSYARLYKDDAYSWKTLNADEVTPDAPNKGQGGKQDKIAEFREKDPHGFAMTIMAMGIVFSCLLALYVFFHIFGWIVQRMTYISKVHAVRALHAQMVKAAVMAKQGTETKGIEYETYMAVIALALHEYEENVHDVESNVLTIVPEDYTEWHHQLPPELL